MLRACDPLVMGWSPPAWCPRCIQIYLGWNAPLTYPMRYMFCSGPLCNSWLELFDYDCCQTADDCFMKIVTANQSGNCFPPIILVAYTFFTASPLLGMFKDGRNIKNCTICDIIVDSLVKRAPIITSVSNNLPVWITQSRFMLRFQTKTQLDVICVAF